MGIGNYFVNYAIARSGDGGNREIKDDSKIEVLGEDEKIIESNRTQAKESSEKWANNIKKQSVETKANDGIKISEFKNKFGDNPIYLYRNELKKLSDEKLIIIQDDNIRLSNKGIDLANLVWEEFV